MSETYQVVLTFKDWMDICYSLGHVQAYYRTKGMDGQAHKYDEIQEKIAEELSNE